MEATETQAKTDVKVPTAVDVKQRDAKLAQLAAARAAKAGKQSERKVSTVHFIGFKTLTKEFGKGLVKGLGFALAGSLVVMGGLLTLAVTKKVLDIPNEG